MKRITNDTTPKQAVKFLQERANEPEVTRDDINAFMKAMSQLNGRVSQLEGRGPANSMDIYIGPIDG